MSTPPAAPPTAKPEVFRRAAPVVLWWAWLVFALINVTDLALQGSGHFAVVVAAVVVAITGAVYACALRPRVVASAAGLTVRNPVRDYRVPWGAVEAVDIGDWVRVHCRPAPGAPGGKTIDCWALFAPARSRLRAGRRAQDRAIASGSRVPDEARGLMAMTAVQVMARRMDERARAERAAGASGGAPAASWAWPSLAAMILPILALAVVALV
ncbi:MAG TPA: PH domain-containing protein [Streptosporangiaceae bacterium]|nr:PH domain-containing protein [Streptosporangiaceae bacterium]